MQDDLWLVVSTEKTGNDKGRVPCLGDRVRVGPIDLNGLIPRARHMLFSSMISYIIFVRRVLPVHLDGGPRVLLPCLKQVTHFSVPLGPHR